MDIRDIADIIGSSVTSRDAAADISRLLTDSRSLVDEEAASTLFFALHTPSNDGHRYVAELYGRGVRHFVVERMLPEWQQMTDAVFLMAPGGAVAALQRVAAAIRGALPPSARVIAITGSRGKTTLKEGLATMFRAAGACVSRSPRSYNSQIGVPLALSTACRHDADTLIIEAGISQRGEMERLEAMIRPTAGIFTNLLDDHAGGFSDDADKAREKARLFAGCTVAVCSADSPMIMAAMRSACRKDALRCWTLGNAEGVDVRFAARHTDDRRTLLEWTCSDGTTGSAILGYNDAASIENACHAATLLLALGYDSATTARVLPLGRFDVDTRTDVMEAVNGCMLIHDRFTHDADSLPQAIDFMRRRTMPMRSTTLIASDFEDVQSNDGRPGEGTALIDMLRRYGVTRLIGIGPQMQRYIAEAGPSCGITLSAYADTDAMLADTRLNFAGELILVKGSDHAATERIVEHLASHRHETVLEVNLDAMTDNFNFYRSKLRPETGIVAMVKASGYGAGSYELAKTLQAQGAAYLAVAVLDEGVELRRAGITMPIMVLNPRVVNYDEMFANRLEPEVFNFETLGEIVAAARRHGIRRYPVHIKLDTGMHRLGFIESDIERLTAALASQEEVVAASMFSHLAAADDPMLDDYTHGQFRRFDTMCDAIDAAIGAPAGGPRIKRHILNSTGITRFTDHQYDMVRLGICLYGVRTMSDGSQQAIRPISSLFTSVISVKEWPAGTPIGYNCRGVCRRDSVIATIPIGYADGIDRHLGNGHMSVWINGNLCPTIGNICMDACMIDVTDCGRGGCRVGDRVEIFGPNVPVERLSDALDTIPYEILTSVSSRVKRVYYRE